MIRAKEEEVVNAASHLFAAFVSFLVTALLMIKLPEGNTLPIFILGLTSSWTFFSSFLYHSSFKEPKRSRNRAVDVAGIYIMIAGSGISISLVCAESVIIGFSSSFLIFAVASFLITKFCLSRCPSEVFLISSCVLLSWLSIFPSTGIFFPSSLPDERVMTLFLIGGLIYSLGVVFYILDSKKWYHTGWHVCVMLGFLFHYVSVCIGCGII